MLKFYISKQKLSCLSNLLRSQEKWERMAKFPTDWFQLAWWQNSILPKPLYKKKWPEEQPFYQFSVLLSLSYKDSSFEMTDTLCSLFLISPIFVCLPPWKTYTSMWNVVLSSSEDEKIGQLNSWKGIVTVCHLTLLTREGLLWGGRDG